MKFTVAETMITKVRYNKNLIEESNLYCKIHMGKRLDLGKNNLG